MEVEEARLWENSLLEKFVSFFLLNVLINNTVIQIFRFRFISGQSGYN